jgi:hypothetical protein
LKLLQPLLQDFTQGSTFSDVGSLNASLHNPTDGVINTTLYISYLSDYIVEISNESVLGPGESQLGIYICSLFSGKSFCHAHYLLVTNFL